MDIRDALTDAYLAGFFDSGSLVRARGYVDAVEALEVVHETSGSLTAIAEVPGTAPAPYRVQFHAEVDESADWVFSACTCPVGRMCKHGAAVALRLRGKAPPLAERQWRQRLSRLSDELEARARSTLTGQALALELVRRPSTRWSRSAAGELSMRPMRPGARRGWARSGAEWSDLAAPVALSRFVPAQVEALRALHRGLASQHTYLVVGAAPVLDDYGDRLVPALRAAVTAGVTLLPGAGVASVAVSDDPARVVADLTRVDDLPTLQVSVQVGERRWRGDDVVAVGRPMSSVALVDGDDVLLAELSEPCHDAVADLLLGPPVVADADDVESFLRALAPLARRMEVTSSDGSLEPPTPARPRLSLTVTWRSATLADLDWAWVYGEHACALADPDPLGGTRDVDLERAILPTVPDELTSIASVAGGDALALALHDLPHLRTLGDVDVEERETPVFRESTSDPEITFTLAEAQPDHTD